MQATADRESVSPARRLAGGALGGAIGGLIFGAIMAATGALPMVAMVVGSESPAVGFLYHMFNSVLVGAIFGLVLGNLAGNRNRAAALGLAYGVLWWVLGPLILMPLLLGMGGPQFGMAFSPPLLISLVGHLLYGLVTGLVYAAYGARG